MHVKYCIGWSYKSSLMQIKQHVEEKTKRDYLEQRRLAQDPDTVKYPKIKITGENYEVEGTKKILSAIVGWIRMAALAMMFLGDTIISSLGGENAPDVFKETTCISVWCASSAWLWSKAPLCKAVPLKFILTTTWNTPSCSKVRCQTSDKSEPYLPNMTFRSDINLQLELMSIITKDRIG